MSVKLSSAIIVAVVLSSVVAIGVVLSIASGESTVGIKTGDWIKVDYTITGAPSGTPLPQWLKVEFLSVEGTNATVRATMHMSDGTEQNATLPVDVVAGGQALGLSGFAIPANLTVGDVVYMSGYGNLTISGETTGSYAGAGRTVVYAGFSQYGTQLTYYWDKLTGVVVEASTISGTMTARAKATETNMWPAQSTGLPIDPTVLFVLIMIAVVVIVAAIAFLVMRKKRAHAEPELHREKDEKKSQVVSGKTLSELEQLTGGDREIYEALSASMFLDPRKIETSMKQAVENARKSEKDGDLTKAGMWYEVAGGLATYEGNVKKVVEHYRDAERVTGRKYLILNNPEKAVAVAQEYYKKVLMI